MNGGRFFAQKSLQILTAPRKIFIHLSERGREKDERKKVWLGKKRAARFYLSLFSSRFLLFLWMYNMYIVVERERLYMLCSVRQEFFVCLRCHRASRTGLSILPTIFTLKVFKQRKSAEKFCVETFKVEAEYCVRYIQLGGAFTWSQNIYNLTTSLSLSLKIWQKKRVKVGWGVVVLRGAHSPDS